MHSPLRIQDILMRPVFQGAQLLAGASGMDRPLRWIHILDILDVRDMLHGGELVLTTGIGFSRCTDDFRSYTEQLIQGNAAGLCIELGTAIQEIPPEILQLADAHNFPLIVFTFQVRFVDITQDVHSLILSRHHKWLDDVENISLSLQERQLFHEQDWVEQVIRGEQLEPSIANSTAHEQLEKHYRAAMIHIPGISINVSDPFSEDWRSQHLHLSMLIRFSFAREQFRPYLSFRRDAILAILEYDGHQVARKSRIIAAIEQLHTILRKNGMSHQGVFVGIGREVDVLSAVERSYQEAATALAIRNKNSDTGVFFYDEAGIYRWVSMLGRNEQARQLAQDDLQPVIEHDRKYHTNLFETLRVYLDCDRSKQQAADRLFIHRQTLYHRLEQLDHLLAIDFEDPVRRLALHVSVYYHLLFGS